MNSNCIPLTAKELKFLLKKTTNCLAQLAVGEWLIQNFLTGKEMGRHLDIFGARAGDEQYFHLKPGAQDSGQVHTIGKLFLSKIDKRYAGQLCAAYFHCFR